MHHPLLKLINEGGSVGGGAISVQGTCECRPKGSAEEAGLVNSHLLPVVMTLVIVPDWVRSGEYLAVFHGKTMKTRIAGKWSQKVLQTFWMRRHDDPLVLGSRDCSVRDQVLQHGVGVIHQRLKSIHPVVTTRRNNNHQAAAGPKLRRSQ